MGTEVGAAPTSRRGLFLTFEGPDGSGKTTQLRLLAEWLRSRGLDPVVLRQPGSTALGERIRAILLDSRSEAVLGPIAPLAELALMFADRAQQIAEVIQPALEAGRVVLCDRYTDSSEAYQGGGRQLGSDRVLAVHRAICNGFQPDATVLLLPDVEVSLARAQQRNAAFQQKHGGADENRFEAEGEAFFRRVHAAYEAIADREPERVLIFRDGGIEEIAAAIRSRLAHLLPESTGTAG
ncbi:dTMP kinase [Terriglobus aquaticus]|uniref:Thymidylate kinase n=1 Tax=Terriglobus aquaticus TaxID=940139 RepID=A0ABW9KKL1_9BACT|nr:dTMP kinase [Terriglobus aquaticus]